MNWKPGDRAIVRLTYSTSDPCEIAINGQPVRLMEVESICPDTNLPYWTTDFAWFEPCHVREDMLRPIDDDYDGHETTSWDECAWKPKREVAI